MNVLVIGGAGYIGSHTVLELCEIGHDFTVDGSIYQRIFVHPYLSDDNISEICDILNS